MKTLEKNRVHPIKTNTDVTELKKHFNSLKAAIADENKDQIITVLSEIDSQLDHM